jgi:SNF2 family DNA or RNA helicase
LLDLFKHQNSFLTKAKQLDNFKYVINFDTQGAFIFIANSKNQPLFDIDYRAYSGIDRSILQILDEANKNDFFNISWEDDNSNIYLHKYPFILEYLKSSDKLHLQNGLKLTFQDKTIACQLTIQQNETTLEAKVLINNEQNFKFLNDKFVVIDNKIFQINPIGEHFNKIKEFNTSFKKEKLEEILTIFLTHFSNVHISYNDFKTITSKEQKLITPALIFESVTSNEELVLKLGATFGSLDNLFFENFNVTKIVLVSELEQTIKIYECDFSVVFETYSFLHKQLNSLKRTAKNGNFTEDEGMFVIEKEIASKFILNELPNLISTCELFGKEHLKKYKYSTSTPSLNVNFKDKIDFLDTSDVTVSLDDEEFNVFEFINMYNKNSYISLKNGEKAIINKSYISKLERIFKKEKSKVKVSFFDLPEIEELIEQRNHKVFKNSRKFYEGFNALKSSKTKIPNLQNVTLRDYQKQGIRWLKYLYDNDFGGCLADDMGLGKTLQAINLLSHIYPKSKTPSLIVMPKSLLNNWANELQKFNPNLSFYIYYATSRDEKKMMKNNVILTSYAIIRNDIEKFKSKTFDTIILDESQNIKNLDSKISKAVMLLDAKHKFALSGTPIENSLFELYSLFRFINNGMFGNINEFKRDFALPIQGNSDEEIAKLLKAKITPFLLRRLKKDVLKELPPKQEQVIYVDMDDEHKKFYNRKRDYYKKILDSQIETEGIASSRFAILQAFNDLLQIASVPSLKSDEKLPSSKIEHMFDMLEDIVANNHKVLIFANFLGSLDAISLKANEKGIEHLIMTGSTSNRQELVDKFQNDEKYKLFLMTLKVGGVGLNLTSADYVFIFDPWWNNAAQSQAIDRVYRIGQKNKVFSYKMITNQTIEEKILKLQEQKQNLTDMVISGDEGGLKQLSQDDLAYILG